MEILKCNRGNLWLGRFFLTSNDRQPSYTYDSPTSTHSVESHRSVYDCEVRPIFCRAFAREMLNIPTILI